MCLIISHCVPYRMAVGQSQFGASLAGSPVKRGMMRHIVIMLEKRSEAWQGPSVSRAGF